MPSARQSGAVRLPPAPPAGRNVCDRTESVPALVSALTAVAAARTADDVAAAAVAGGREITGARAAALGMLDGSVVVIVASTGYDCDTMAAGATLPLDAGLPLTECARTGRTVVRGDSSGPAWAAVPVGGPTLQAALLVSLPPGPAPDLTALQTLARSTADALRRSLEVPAQGPSVVHVAAPDWLEVAVVLHGTDGVGRPGGDVVVAATGAGPDDAWLVVADVCGNGADAAPAATEVMRLVRALTAADLDPAGLLASVDRALTRDPAFDRFVTATAARLRRHRAGVDIDVASAGHPPLLVWADGEVRPVEVSGRPLNLDTEPRPPLVDGQQRLTLRSGQLLVAHTDGLVDRGHVDHSESLHTLLAGAGRLAAPALVADVLTTGLEAAGGPARDDQALAVVALR